MKGMCVSSRLPFLYFCIHFLAHARTLALLKRYRAANTEHCKGYNYDYSLCFCRPSQHSESHCCNFSVMIIRMVFFFKQKIFFLSNTEFDTSGNLLPLQPVKSGPCRLKPAQSLVAKPSAATEIETIPHIVCVWKMCAFADLCVASTCMCVCSNICTCVACRGKTRAMVAQDVIKKMSDSANSVSVRIQITNKCRTLLNRPLAIISGPTRHFQNL